MKSFSSSSSYKSLGSKWTDCEVLRETLSCCDPVLFRGWPLSLISRVDRKLNGKSDGRDKRLGVSSLRHNRWSTRVRFCLLFQTGRDHPRRQRNKHHQFSVLPSPMTTEGTNFCPATLSALSLSRLCATLCVDDGVGSRDNLDGTKGPLSLASAHREEEDATKGKFDFSWRGETTHFNDLTILLFRPGLSLTSERLNGQP